MAVDYKEFNLFQTAFYTNIEQFGKYSRFDFAKHGYTLLNNMAKEFPNLANIIYNLNGIGWKGAESPAILKALQRNFVNNFNKVRIPQSIYWKTLSETKSKVKVKTTEHGLIFDDEIKSEIMGILLIDSKTYEYLKFSERVQFLGKQINGEFIIKEASKTVRKKKSILG